MIGTVPQWVGLGLACIGVYVAYLFMEKKVRKEAIPIENVIYPKGREETGRERSSGEGSCGKGAGTINRGDSEERNDPDSAEPGKDIPSTSEYPRKVKLVIRKDRSSKLK